MNSEKIVKALQKATKLKEVHLEFPEREEHGDYATNVAMQVFAKIKKSKVKAKKFKTSNEVAAEVIRKLRKDKELKKLVDKIEIAGPGFINFWLTRTHLVKVLQEVLQQKDKYGKSNLLKGKKYLIEHTSPDPIKTIHIGHLRNNFLGMSVGNILEFLGAKVTLDCINNDRGTHVNRAIFGYLVFGRKNQSIKSSEKSYIKAVVNYELTDKDIKKAVQGKSWENMLSEWSKNKSQWYVPNDFKITSDKFDNTFYSLGQRSSELVKGVDDQVQAMLKAWEDKHQTLRKLWRQIIDWSLEGYQKTYQRIGSHHDKVWHESDFYQEGKVWVEKGLKKSIFKKLSDGAVLSNLKKFGLPDAIIIKKDGTAVYHTQDLQLTYLKAKKYPSDLYVWDIGNEQKLYLQQLYAMCEQLGIAKKNQLFHLNYGFLTLKDGKKMSSRYGSVINGEDLLDELQRKAREIIDKSKQELRGDISEKKKKELTEQVALASCKYGFLRYSREKDVVFSIDESLSLEGNSGPYLQYTYARTQSVLRKVKAPRRATQQGRQRSKVKSFDNLNLNKEELALMRAFPRFSEVISDAAKNYSPNLLCNYLYDLASKFNTFYNMHKILETPSTKHQTPSTRDFRLALTAATGQILKNGLNLLGIQAPHKM
jgi:arginyl-tRNA synthetase